MPIAFARVTYHTRTQGHSAVAGSAYRSGQTLHDERTGITHHFEKRDDIAYESIMLPSGATESFKDRETLWNSVERAEKRKNSQVAKDVVLALPKELSLEENITLARQFAHTHFVSKGLVVDLAIHLHSKDNPHAHLYVTTRRLEGNRFSRLKARDLQPKVAKGFVVEGDAWGEQWRHFQNDYFKQHAINLMVDPNHVVTRRHEGYIHSNEPHYLKEENQLRHAESKTILLHEPASLLNILTTRVGVFSERDVARLVFKTLDEKEGKAVFNEVMAKLLAHRDIIRLGKGDDGCERYTTRAHFGLELDLNKCADVLENRRSGRISGRQVRAAIKTFSLSDEQRQALGYLMRHSGLRILVGRAGTGKSYLMKAARQVWETGGYQVVGMAPSAVAANALADASGMACRTVAYYQKLWALGKLTWDKHTVVVMDEAGMTDLVAMHAITQAVRQTGAKLVLLGDDAQLLPVGKGAPLRALSEAYGFCELSSIRRQRKTGDRQASHALSQGKLHQAIRHYNDQHAIHYAFESCVFDDLVSDWAAGVSSSTLSERLILTHRNVDVARLNQVARARLIRQGVIDTAQEITVGQGRSFALGERVLFLKSNTSIGVFNGDKGRVMACTEKVLHIRLDNGTNVTVDTARYRALDYGYAMTVHKAQGATVDEAFVLVNSMGWDKHLSYVAMTRHRHGLVVYANQSIANNADRLTEQLSRHAIKDNVLDFPLFYAIRRGFAPEVLVNRLVNRVRRVKTVATDSWAYLFRYAAFKQQRAHRERVSHAQQARNAQHRVAELARVSQQWGEAWRGVLGRVPLALWVGQLQAATDEKSDPAVFRFYQSFIEAVINKRSCEPATRDKLYQLQVKRNRLGSAVYRRLSHYARGVSHYAITREALEKMHYTYRQHQAVFGLMRARDAGKIELVRAYAYFILQDIQGHWPHLVQAASQNHLPLDILSREVIRFGRAHFYQTVYPTLSIDEQIRVRELHRLSQLDRQVSLRWQAVMNQGGAGKLTAHQKEWLEEMTAARDERALDYLKRRDEYAAWSWLYSFSTAQLNRFEVHRLAYERVRDYYAKGCTSLNQAKQIILDRRSHHKFIHHLSGTVMGGQYVKKEKQEKQKKRLTRRMRARIKRAQLRLLSVYQYCDVCLPARYRRLHTKTFSLLTTVVARHARRKSKAVAASLSLSQRKVWGALIRFESLILQQLTLQQQLKQRINALDKASRPTTYQGRMKLLMPTERQRWDDLQQRMDSIGYYLGMHAHLLGKTWLSYFGISKAWVMNAFYRERLRRAATVLKSLPADSPLAYQWVCCLKNWGTLSRSGSLLRRVLSETQAWNAFNRCDVLWESRLADLGQRVQLMAEIKAHNKPLAAIYVELAKVTLETVAQTIYVNPLSHQTAVPFKLSSTVSFYEVEAVNTALSADFERFYNHYLGDDGRRVGVSLRYGKKGSFSVTRAGVNAGCWYSFETGEGGSPIQFLMSREQGLGLSFKEALVEGARFSGFAPNQLPRVIDKPKLSVSNELSEAQEKTKRIARACGYFEASQSIKETLAERYLRGHRQLNGDLSAFRFHPAIYDGGSQQSYPAVLVAARDVDGQVTAVQTILLDKITGQKAVGVSVVKRTHGVVKGSAVLIHEGSGSQVVIAEGPETGASLIEALPEANIYITLGNIKNAEHLGWLAEKHGARDIYFAADNDGQNQRNLDAIDAVSGVLEKSDITCHRSYPVIMGRDTCDFNDVLCEKGTNEVRQQVQMWQLLVPTTHAKKPEEQKALELCKDVDWRAPELQKEWQKLAQMTEKSSPIDTLCFWYKEWKKETNPSKKVRIEKNLSACARKLVGRKIMFEALKSITPKLVACFKAIRRSHEKTHARSR